MIITRNEGEKGEYIYIYSTGRRAEEKKENKESWENVEKRKIKERGKCREIYRKKRK